MNTLKFFIKRYLSKLYKWLVFAFIDTVLVSAISLLHPIISKHIFDRGILQADKQIIIGFGIILFLTYCINHALSFINELLFNVLSNRFIAEVKKDVFSRVIRMPMEFFDDKQSGYILERVNEINSLGNVLSPAVFQPVTSMITAMGSAAMLFILNWKLLLVNLCFLPVFIVLSSYSSNGIKNSSKTLYETMASASGTMQEGLSGIGELKAIGGEKDVLSKISDNIHLLMDKSITRNKQLSLSKETLMLLTKTVYCAIIVISGILIANKELSIGDYIAVTQYSNLLFAPVQLLASFNIIIQPSFIVLTRLKDLFDIKTEDEINGTIAINHIESIRFKNVNFCYPGGKESVLEDFNFEINKEETIAIVGPNGTGKSTIIKLLLGLYKNYEGSILINNIELRDIDIESLRSRISIVTQNIRLFKGTVKDNIKIANPNITDHEIERVLKMSHLDEFQNNSINYNSVLSEDGKNLSGGQKQKIAIARMLAKKSDIMIYDEATSHLDEESRLDVANSIKSMFKDKSCIVVTHDAELAKCCNRIVSIRKR